LRGIDRFRLNSPLLPDALKNENPLGIERLVNGEKTRDRAA